jgi:2-keto-4-pentenoate hydratase/2-oxohepta-3-ene-1,7-dioic acid hydratase in catechol pathway
MKLVTFSSSAGEARLGVLLDKSGVLDLQSASEAAGHGKDPAFSSMQAMIEGGKSALDRARALEQVPPAGCRYDIGSSARLLAPLPRPEQIRDCLSFDQHMIGCAEAVRQRLGLADITPRHRLMIEAMQQRPIYYKANRFAVTGTDTEVVWPAYSVLRDYELEMAAVIGRRIKDATPAEAREAIFGYTIFNDFSARDTQTIEGDGGLGPAKAKDFDNANALGPCIVTSDAFDPYNATMIARINGEVQSTGHSSTIDRTFEDQISYISQCETLHPGEMIGSGTIGGGCGLETGRMLEHGDLIELEIEGIGVLRNRIVVAS